MIKFIIVGVMILLSHTFGEGVEHNSTKTVEAKKVLVIDLDRSLEKGDSKSFSMNPENGDKSILSISLNGYRGDNDEVALRGEVLKRANKIKIGDNDEVAFRGEEYIIKTAELKEHDSIVIQYGEGDEVIIEIRRD